MASSTKYSITERPPKSQNNCHKVLAFSWLGDIQFYKHYLLNRYYAPGPVLGATGTKIKTKTKTKNKPSLPSRNLYSKPGVGKKNSCTDKQNKPHTKLIQSKIPEKNTGLGENKSRLDFLF